jgi:hypothetical protein
MYIPCYYIKKLIKNICKIRHLITIVINNGTNEHYGAY